MTEKRFTLSLDTEWWIVGDNTIQVNEYGYRDDLVGEDKYRGLKQELTEQEVVDLLNELNDECEFLEIENESLEDGATKYAEWYHKSLKENEQLKQSNQKAIELILDGIVEMHDGKRDYAETLFNKAIQLLKDDVE